MRPCSLIFFYRSEVIFIMTGFMEMCLTEFAEEGLQKLDQIKFRLPVWAELTRVNSDHEKPMNAIVKILVDSTDRH